MKFGNIINEILEVYNLNATEFADKIGVQRSSISHVLSGRNKPSLEFIIKIKNEFEELRWDYLLLGQKPMTRQEALAVNQSSHFNEQTEIRYERDHGSPPTLHINEEKEKLQIEAATLNKNVMKQKKIKKIVWFYTDNTYEVFENE